MMGNGKMDSKREKGKISKIKIFYQDIYMD